MVARIQLRRDLKSNWQSVNPILANGELGIEQEGATEKIKYGDGVTRWNSLNYIEIGDDSVLRQHISNVTDAHGINGIYNSINQIKININNLDNRIDNLDL